MCFSSFIRPVVQFLNSKQFVECAQVQNWKNGNNLTIMSRHVITRSLRILRESLKIQLIAVMKNDFNENYRKEKSEENVIKFVFAIEVFFNWFDFQKTMFFLSFIFIYLSIWSITKSIRAERENENILLERRSIFIQFFFSNEFICCTENAQIILNLNQFSEILKVWLQKMRWIFQENSIKPRWWNANSLKTNNERRAEIWCYINALLNEACLNH